MDNSLVSLGVFIDLSKAFDSVSHRLLLDAMEGVGIRGVVLRFFESYLIDRRQAVRVENSNSEYKIIKYGVPQGSVLGPVLFNIYLNDLFFLDTVGELIAYADDTCVFYAEENWNSLKLTATKDLTKIFNWFNSKLLTVNYDKTRFLPFFIDVRSSPTFNTISISNNLTINGVEEFKYLGVILDGNLKWGGHIKHVIKKIQFLFHKFKILRDVIEFNMLKIVYMALVQSHLIYGILAWGNANANIMQNLECAQKRIIKIMLRKPPTYSSDDLFMESSFMDPRQLFYYNMCTYQQKNKKCMKKIDHAYGTRYKDITFISQKACKFIGQKAHTYLGPRLYSTLPSHLQSIMTERTFKIKLKQHIYSLPRDCISQLVENRALVFLK